MTARWHRWSAKAGAGTRISALAPDPDGSLWIGTAAGALLHFRDGRFLPSPPLPWRDLGALLVDRDGALAMAFQPFDQRLHGASADQVWIADDGMTIEHGATRPSMERPCFIKLRVTPARGNLPSAALPYATVWGIEVLYRSSPSGGSDRRAHGPGGFPASGGLPG